MSKTLPAITCLVPPRLDAPVTLLSSASRAKGQILWPFVTCCCVLLHVVTFVTRNYCCNWLYNMIYTMHIIHIWYSDVTNSCYYTCDIVSILMNYWSFSWWWCWDHDGGGTGGAGCSHWGMSHSSRSATGPGLRWCVKARILRDDLVPALYIRFAVAGMCWMWCVCFKLPYDNITHFFWTC